MEHKYVDRLYWPRCGFKFFLKETPDWATRPYIWRRCERAWGHWLFESPCRHEGRPVKHEST